MHRFSLFLMISILIHCAFYFSVFFAPAPPTKKEALEIAYISEKDKVPTPKEPLQKNRQIVDQNDKALNDETPDKDYYLSKNNQRVLKETVAKNKGEFKNTNEKKTTQMRLQKPQIQTPNQAKKSETFNPMSDMSAKFREKAFNTMASSAPSNPATASQTQDYLKNVNYGVETVLNTKEFKYYTYFNRIRRQLSEHWEPTVRDKLSKMFRQGRTIASNQDRTTKLLIILDTNGVLVKVQLVSDSGVKDLDEAAIESFRSAAPFPNPPKGIIEPDGTVKIRWDFVLES